MVDEPEIRMPLTGIRIADLGMVWGGAYITKLMADMGAQVIKVESPTNMDVIRALNVEAGGKYYNTSPYFNGYNRNKFGVGLDIGRPQGLDIFKQLVRVSDVVVENYRTDVSIKLGVTYEELRKVRPDLIMLSMQTYGRTGPLRDYPGYGPMSEYMAGLTSMSGYVGDEPQKIGISYGDPTGGIAGAGAIVTALLYRQRTGKGQHIELAMRDNVIGLIGEAVLDWSMNKRLRASSGNQHDAYVPHGCYPCAGNDRWITIAVQTDAHWHGLAAAMGQPALVDDPRYALPTTRWQHQDTLDKIVIAWTQSRTPDEVFFTLQAHAVPVGKVMTAQDLLADPHLHARGFYQPMTHADAGTWPLDVPVWRFSATPGSFQRAAPKFGEHNAYVLQDILKLSAAEVADLAAKGIIGEEPKKPDQV